MKWVQNVELKIFSITSPIITKSFLRYFIHRGRPLSMYAKYSEKLTFLFCVRT